MTRARLPLLLAGASAFVLVGCTDPAHLNSGSSKTTEGALLGGAIGGILGAATAGSNTGRSAAIGVAAGALAGGLIGQQLEKQAADLESTLSNDDIQVINTGSELKVIMPQGILFASDSSSVNSAVLGDMGALSRNLQQYPDSTIQVIGHTDNTGSASHNQALSEQRAQSVASILTSNGVLSSRISSIGMGENQPVASNLNEEGKALNRRVEVVIKPNS